MYVTIARLSCGHITVYATSTAEPPALPDGTVAECTARLCPPEQVDRTTGAIRPVERIVNIDRSLAAAIARTTPAADLAGPVVGVLVHVGIGRLVAVGPFDGPDKLDQWWHWHANRFAMAGIVCVSAALTSAPVEATEDGR